MKTDGIRLKDQLIWLIDRISDIPPASAALSAGGLVTFLAMFGYIANTTKLALYGVPRDLVSFSTEELLFATGTLFQLPVDALSSLVQSFYPFTAAKALVALCGLAYVVVVWAAVILRDAKSEKRILRTVGVLSDLAAFSLSLVVMYALFGLIFGFACNKYYLIGISHAAANDLYHLVTTLLGWFFLGALLLGVLAVRLLYRSDLKAYGKAAGAVFGVVFAASLLLLPVFAGALQAYHFRLPPVEIPGEEGTYLLLYENGGLMYVFNESKLETEIYALERFDEFRLGSFKDRKTLSDCYTIDTQYKESSPPVTSPE